MKDVEMLLKGLGGETLLSITVSQEAAAKWGRACSAR